MHDQTRKAHSDTTMRASALLGMWTVRGTVVGASLGGGFGTVVPIYGTAIGSWIGLMLGVGFGLATGLLLRIFTFATRRDMVDGDDPHWRLASRAVPSALIAVAALVVGAQPAVGHAIAFAVAGVGLLFALFAPPPIPGAFVKGAVHRNEDGSPGGSFVTWYLIAWWTLWPIGFWSVYKLTHW